MGLLPLAHCRGLDHWLLNWEGPHYHDGTHSCGGWVHQWEDSAMPHTYTHTHTAMLQALCKQCNTAQSTSLQLDLLSSTVCGACHIHVCQRVPDNIRSEHMELGNANLICGLASELRPRSHSCVRQIFKHLDMNVSSSFLRPRLLFRVLP